MKEARERPSAKSYGGEEGKAWGKNEARGRRQEPRANKRPSAKTYGGERQARNEGQKEAKRKRSSLEKRRNR